MQVLAMGMGIRSPRSCFCCSREMLSKRGGIESLVSLEAQMFYGEM